MKPIPITEVDILQEVCVFGKKMLFTILRVNIDSLPEGLFRYDIRHCDDDWSAPATIEKTVLVNHMGAVITDEKFDLGENGYLCFDKEDDFYITDRRGIDPSNIDNVLNYFKELKEEREFIEANKKTPEITVTYKDVFGFYEVNFKGTKMLYASVQIDDPSNLPEGLHMYNICHDQDPFNVIKGTDKRYYGSLITDKELEVNDEGFVDFEQKDFEFTSSRTIILPNGIEKYFNCKIKTEDNLMSKAKFYNKTVKAIQLSADNFDDVNEFTGNELFICSKRVDGEVEYAIMTRTGKMSIVRVGDFIVMEDGELHVVSCERFLDAYRPV